MTSQHRTLSRFDSDAIRRRLSDESRELGLTKQELRLCGLILDRPDGVTYNDLYDRMYDGRKKPASRAVIKAFVCKIRSRIKDCNFELAEAWTSHTREIGVHFRWR